ncbi:hypothetical protein EJ04DRAFT_39471 [Polyplosphaeria fusca]|uniref:Rhodopsin domain-containing protein n=1 Tax=Polyplosphaeria fusca TaxID=682080 RepID=A0A9P4QT06_9PLEO|nr:hypothetical protein EJ04DRAFT_39471 [Polyplosphaeria fusca]
MSAFTPEQLAYMEAHRDDSRVAEIHAVYSVPIVVSVLSTGLRLWAKKAGRNGVTLDDYLISFATICLVGQCASGLGFGPPHGMGRHVIFVSPHDLMIFRLGDYVFSHFYDIALVSVKLGILAFYYRIFVVPLFRKIVLATAAIVIGWGIGITVTLALVCQPTAAFWDDRIKGTCLNLGTFTYFTNISNLVTDIWIFLMPVPVIWHLQLQTKKKLLLCFIFCMGLGTCIVSALRLRVVLGHTDPDFTWSTVPLGAYSAFEPLGGILCSNMPIIWHMWRKRRPLLPGSSAFKTAGNSSTATPGSNQSRRSRVARRLQDSLGLSQADQTGNDSQARTILGHEEGARWAPPSSLDLQKGNSAVIAHARPAEAAEYFNQVGRRDTSHTQDISEAGSSKQECRDSGEQSEDGNRRHSRGPPKSQQGMRKTVWEVRKK